MLRPYCGDVQIRKAVAIVVANRHAHAVAAGRHAGLCGDVGEGAVTIVAIERVAQGRIRSEEIALAAVDQVDVHPPVVVVVEESASRAGSLRQESLRRLPVHMCPGDTADGMRNLFKRIDRFRQSAGQARQSTEGDTARQPPQKFPPGEQTQSPILP